MGLLDMSKLDFSSLLIRPTNMPSHNFDAGTWQETGEFPGNYESWWVHTACEFLNYNKK